MKLLISAILLSMSASSFADCLVELSGTNTNPFIENSCREALRECNKYKRTNNIQYGKCETIDSNYGRSTGNGYPPGNGGDIYSRIQSMNIVDQVSLELYQGLSIKRNVQGTYSQLYVYGQFKGNYNENDFYQMEQLRSKLRRMTNGYKHPLKSNRELRRLLNLSNNRTLIQDFTDGFYRNCYVTPYVDGRYHQVYVNGRFKGNFDISFGNGRRDLEDSLRRLVSRGTCYRN
jgi:hypothetical protein